MVPRFAGQDIVNGCQANAVFTGEFCHGNTVLPFCDDGQHVGLGELGHAVSLTAKHSLRVNPGKCAVTGRHAVTRHGVGHVVIMRAEFEVGGIAATPVVASVTHDQSVGNRTVDQREDQAMSTPEYAVSFELSVSPSCDSALPFPASSGTTGLVNQKPGIFRSLAFRFPVASLRAPFTTIVIESRRCFGKWLTANTTSALNGHNRNLHCKATEKGGRGSVFPLVGSVISAALALRNVTTIIPHPNGSLAVLPVMAGLPPALGEV